MEKMTPFEALSFELNRLRERRVAERRATLRESGDRRSRKTPAGVENEPDPHTLDSSNQTP